MAEDTPTPDEQAPEEQAAPQEEQLDAAEAAAAQAVPMPDQPEDAQDGPADADAVAQVDEAPAAETGEPPAADADAAADETAEADDDAADEPETPRERPAIPGADLEVDLVLDSEQPAGEDAYDYGEEGESGPDAGGDDEDVVDEQPVAATIDLAAGARYRATGKRKTSVARVILRPGNGEYLVNGKPLDTYFPRPTLQRQIRQPLEAVGYDDRMDVVARLHGGGVSSQAGALRHGISRALIDADPNLRGELKRRGFLTRDARVKERKKAGLKKARKRPQFSKR